MLKNFFFAYMLILFIFYLSVFIKRDYKSIKIGNKIKIRFSQKYLREILLQIVSLLFHIWKYSELTFLFYPYFKY